MTQHTSSTPPTESETYPELTIPQWTRLVQLAEKATDYINSISQDTSNLDVYVVGGAVRDALIGENANDYDFVVVGETVDSMLDRGFRDINASSFGVLHDENREEWALARTESKPEDAYGYKGIDVDTEDVTLREDLTRRDLRMNAMAIRLENGLPDAFSEPEAMELPGEKPNATFIDPFNGRGDIETMTIRHVSDAFSEDPIRVLRAARYAARYEYTPPRADCGGTHLSIDEDTKRLMQMVAPELNRMSRDRIGEEVVKAMKQASDPTRFWGVLREVGALAVLAPNLDRASIVPAGPEEYHREGDTYTHTMLVLTQMHEICESREITGMDRVRRYMMAVAHDLGKVTLADEQGGLWSDDPPRRFGGHADVGVQSAENLAARLGLDGHLSETMQDASELHMDIHDLPAWDPFELVEFVDRHDPAPEADTPYRATIEEILDLAQADHQGRFQNDDVFTDEVTYEEDPDAPDGAARPVFHRDVFIERVNTTRTAIEEISGFEILRTGLCDDHAETDVLNEDLAGQLGRCDQCRTPGPWVGDELNTKRREFITQE